MRPSQQVTVIDEETSCRIEAGTEPYPREEGGENESGVALDVQGDNLTEEKNEDQ